VDKVALGQFCTIISVALSRSYGTAYVLRASLKKLQNCNLDDDKGLNCRSVVTLWEFTAEREDVISVT
jgi:hypothetical protein